MPKHPPIALDVMQASLAQLTKLLAEILQLYLTSQYLIGMGMKATMAHQVYNAFHLTASSSTSATSTSPVTSTSPATATSMFPTSMQYTEPISLTLPPPPPKTVSIQPPPRTALIQPPLPGMAELAALFSQYLCNTSSG